MHMVAHSGGQARMVEASKMIMLRGNSSLHTDAGHLTWQWHADTDCLLASIVALHAWQL